MAEAANDNERTYNGVTQDIWNCIKTTSTSEHGTKYSGPDQGTATTKIVFIGSIVLSYLFTPAAGTLWYRIDSKPGIVSTSQVWNGLEETLTGCGGTA